VKTVSDIVTYSNHPAQAAALVKLWPDIPPELDTIIIQHHERPDGSGFPAGLTHQKIIPLAAIFIVAEDLVNAIFKSPNQKLDVAQFLETRAKIYESGPLR